MKVSVFGLGYVGTVLAGCLAREGHSVIGVDVDRVKLDLFREGKAPIVEEGIQDLIAEGIRGGRIEVSGDTTAAVMNSEVSFVCVGTPSGPDGGQNLGGMIHLSDEIGVALRSKSAYHVVAIRSTILPGTIETVVLPRLVKESGKRPGVDFDVCAQPEFLREGSSIRDYFAPPFTVIGSDSSRATALLRQLFDHLPCETIVTDIRSAEIMKFACNTFHALKITFANEIGRVCKAQGIDARVVMDFICRDTKLNLSRAYLAPGFAFGGSCLPKDVRALVSRAQEAGIDLPMMSAILPSNERHVSHVTRLIEEQGKSRIGMIGLSFKGGTDDLRESPLVTLAEQLLSAGRTLRIYDPEVNVSRLIGANRRYIEHVLPHLESMLDQDLPALLAGSELVVVGISTPEILRALESGLGQGTVVVDLVGLREPPGSRPYHGVCW